MRFLQVAAVFRLEERCLTLAERLDVVEQSPALLAGHLLLVWADEQSGIPPGYLCTCKKKKGGSCLLFIRPVFVAVVFVGEVFDWIVIFLY